MMSADWARWIMASSAVYFKNIANGIPLPLLVEGIDERQSSTMHYDHAELRVGGPFPTELSHDYYQLSVDMNVLVTELMREQGDNAYELITWCGVFQQAMDGPINVYKYGNLAQDDSSWVGCLRPRQGKFEANRILHFGQINKVDRIRQSVIDGRFTMYI